MILKYISEVPAEGNHAGNKARRDVDAIFARRGYEPIENIVETRFGSTLEKIKYTFDSATWKKVLRLRRSEGQVVLAQFPVYGNKIMRAALNDFFDRNRMVFVVHDLDALRNFGGADTSDEIARLNRAEILIVHNERMMGALFGLGVRTPMIGLEVFDYLLDKPPAARSVVDRDTIIFAGNLAKSAFLRSIGALNVNFNLYGPRGNENFSAANANYVGSFAPDDIPFKLDGGFGLIWDGDSIDTCSGAFGEYLKLNNPHKLSLYIAAGLPVVTWTGAAIADFIVKYGLGFVVDSLRELPSKLQSISDADYHSMLKHSASMQSKLVDGYFTKRALEQAERMLRHE